MDEVMYEFFDTYESGLIVEWMYKSIQRTAFGLGI